MKSTTVARILTLKGGWKMADDADEANYPQYVSERVVKLAIEGNPKNGYNLIMIPDGCFAADTHHSTVEDALADAKKRLGYRQTIGAGQMTFNKTSPPDRRVASLAGVR